MSLRNSPLDVGRLRGTVYDFDDAGDLLPMHVHQTDVHITIVALGSFVARGAGWEISLEQGKIYDWDEGQWHEFEAMEPMSRLINIIKQ
jgi:hypothetical protein